MKITNEKPYNWVKILFWSESDHPESMWAIPDSENRYFIIDNIPFYTYGISLWDLVEVKKNRDWILEFVKIIKRSWHSTIRIFWQTDEYITAQEFLKEYKLKHSSIETTGKLYALDISWKERQSVNSILSSLQEKENKGELIYEEGYVSEFTD